MILRDSWKRSIIVLRNMRMKVQSSIEKREHGSTYATSAADPWSH